MEMAKGQSKRPVYISLPHLPKFVSSTVAVYSSALFTNSKRFCSCLRFSLGKVTPGSYQLVASHSVWDIVKVKSIELTKPSRTVLW